MYGTILIVERDPALRSALSEVLSMAGFKPLTAVSREEVVSLLTENPDPVSYALLGIHTPREDDEKLVHSLKELQPGVKVILSSGHHEDTLRTAIKVPQDAAVTFLRKPFTSRGLLDHLKEIST